VNPTRFQVNEITGLIHPHVENRPTFIGIRESMPEANATVEKLKAEYREAGYIVEPFVAYYIPA
jgi:hypothetical protein